MVVRATYAQPQRAPLPSRALKQLSIPQALQLVANLQCAQVNAHDWAIPARLTITSEILRLARIVAPGKE
jgi:hypothetical protein